MVNHVKELDLKNQFTSNLLSVGFDFILALVLVSTLFAQQAHAQATAAIGWNADTAQVAGYNVYYGTSSGNYSTTVNAGSNTTATLQNLSAQTYYIALTAYNSANEQSGYSPELVVDALIASAGAAERYLQAALCSRARVQAKPLPLLLLPATQ